MNTRAIAAVLVVLGSSLTPSVAGMFNLAGNDHVLILGEDDSYDDWYYEFGGSSGSYVGRAASPILMPRSLATDGSYIYVGDYLSDDVLRYTYDGVYQGIFVDNTLQHTGGSLRHIAFDGTGALYASPAGFSSEPRWIAKYDTNGDLESTFSHEELVFPDGIAVASDGTVYVGQTTGWEKAIYRFAADGSYQGRFDVSGLSHPADIDIDRSTDTLFVANHYGTEIDIYSTAGSWLGAIPLPGITYGSGLYFDPESGHLFVTGWSSENAIEIGLDGTLYRTFSGGGLGTPSDIITASSTGVIATPEPASIFLALLGAPVLFWFRPRGSTECSLTMRCVPTNYAQLPPI